MAAGDYDEGTRMTNITKLNDRRPFQFTPPLAPPERIDPAAKFEISHTLNHERHTHAVDDYGIRQMERETRIVGQCIYALAIGLALGACLGWWAYGHWHP
jgi:hypothetical protein